jgi:hypothetical protein
VDIGRLEPVVWAELKALLLEPEWLLRSYRAALAEEREQHERLRQYIANLDDRLQKVEETKRGLLRAYIDPDVVIPKEEFVAERTRLD